MGLYTEFHFKADIDKDIPEDVVIFLINTIYQLDLLKSYNPFHCAEYLKNEYKELIERTQDKIVIPDHPLFKLPRWKSLFSKTGLRYNSTYPQFIQHVMNYKDTQKRNKYWYLQLDAEINYGYVEIQQFISWIKPYIASRKKKIYVGWYRLEGTKDQINIYIER